MKKVVLAFSGGLDTSYCALYLKEKMNLEVHSVFVDTGGWTPEELVTLEKHAYNLGVSTHKTLSQAQQFYDDCIKYLIAGNILRNNSYPLSVSAERMFQALAVAEYAQKIDAAYVAHGSTGAGNDQVRFDLAFRIVCPELSILSPIRAQNLSREEELNFLQDKGVQFSKDQALYSINKGLWGTSVGGKETLSSDLFLPDSAFPTQVTKQGSEQLDIEFEKGEPVSFAGKEFTHPRFLIEALHQYTAPYGIGRDLHVGDTIIGIKGRVGFEAPAPHLLIRAHHALEKHVLTKEQLALKEQLSAKYGAMIHEGLFLEPALRDIEKFLESSQQMVSGTVKVFLAPYRFHITGIQSKHDLMSPQFAQYGELNRSWSGDDVKGFSKILGNQQMIYRKVNQNA